MEAEIEFNRFYFPVGSALNKLSPAAALMVCQHAADRGLSVTRIEGGFRLGETFEARLDCIWDGFFPVEGEALARRNNDIAASFIVEKQVSHNAFILTVAVFGTSEDLSRVP